MGKQPTQGQKKSKDAISKAASSKKAAPKKWTKGKAKEKVDNACFLDQATYDKILTAIPKLGKHISTSIVIDKFKVLGSIARIMLKRCEENGTLKRTESHSRQALYYPAVAAVEKPAAEVKETKKEKAAKKK